MSMMNKVEFLYGKKKLTAEFAEERLQGVLRSHLEEYSPEASPEELISRAMASPYGGKTLRELAVGKKKVVLIASDHTRPVPSKLLIPPMLREIREGNPSAEITILVATGCHRDSRREELLAKFGEEILDHEEIRIHNCDDEENLVSLGILPSGAELRINRLAAEADLLCAEGFIEPHFFAGFSGGRKSVLPGICARKTVVGNHCSAFIDDPHCRTGILEGNLIHRDMLAAASMAKLAYISNVVLNSAHEVLYAVAGEPESAHGAGCDFLRRHCRVAARPADLVLTTNGGYPLDQNIYQAVKGMTAAEATVKEGGVIIMMAASEDGHGGENFYRFLAEEKDNGKLMARFLATSQDATPPDQWQAQIFVRVLQKARVIYLSEAPDETVRALHMLPAHSLEEAIRLAETMLEENYTVTAIPDGVSVIVS